jgi:FAD/FMN-containing dehydrogenase
MYVLTIEPGWNIALEWTDSSEDDTMLHIAKSSYEAIESDAKKMKKDEPFLYLNDANWTQNPFVRYGEGNFKRLKEIRDKFDPNGVFTKLCKGGFKLE